MDRLTSMQVFVTVVETGSFAKASERHGFSRAMVTRHVMELEHRLGARLLNRTTRKLSLTEAGAAYFERCQQVLVDVEEADAVVAHLSGKPRGRLRINAALSFGVRYLAPVVGQYLQRYPEVTVDLSLNDRIVDLVEEGYDLAIRIGALVPSNLIARKLGVTRLVVCGSPEYFARRGMPRIPADLSKHCCFAYSYWTTPDQWPFTDAAGRTEVVKVAGTFTANNGDALCAAAVGGAGLIYEPSFIVADDLAAGRLTAALADYDTRELGIHAVYASRRHLSAKVRTFVDFLAERFAADAPWERWTPHAIRSSARPPPHS
ncbi:MAG: LysR family transcriptional regulator [Betaproteobacteria bacterium]|nr:LysR family transcriptional regulator [Betaproteobacteria bacterium]